MGAGADPKQLVVTETRVFSRRDAAGEDVYRVTLDRGRVKVRWGRAGAEPRLQVTRFNTADAARADYYARLADLQAKGFLDATSAG